MVAMHGTLQLSSLRYLIHEDRTRGGGGGGGGGKKEKAS